MRRRTRLFAGLLLLGLAAFAAYAAWAVWTASGQGAGWAGLGSAWPYLLAGVVTVACAIAAFLRLAFFSESHGYDDRADINRR